MASKNGFNERVLFRLGWLLWAGAFIVSVVGTSAKVQSGEWSAWGYALPAIIVLVPLVTGFAFVIFAFFDTVEEGEAIQYAAPADNKAK